MGYGVFCYSEYEDGSVEISYQDIGTYHGMDYEATYKLDWNAAEQLRSALSVECTGTLEEILTEKFGVCLNKSSFSAFLSEHKIEYELFTWVSWFFVFFHKFGNAP